MARPTHVMLALLACGAASTSAWVATPLGGGHRSLHLVGAARPALVRHRVGALRMVEPGSQVGQTLVKAAEGLSKVVEAKTSATVPALDTAALAKAAEKVANFASHAPQAVQKQLSAVLASIPAELLPFALAAVPATALIFLAASANKAASAPTSPYPNLVYDAEAAKAYYEARPLEYFARLAFIASAASSFGAALALDYLTERGCREYFARLAFIASAASSFGAGLALDYLTGGLEKNADARADTLTDLLTQLGPTYIKSQDSLTGLLTQLGPTYIKVGQALSIRSDLVPPAYIKSLTQLQDKV
ncbi:hypothetical protein T484DRAFT_1799137 [Baffinella frigidus]|nr:hypothetical protein T484DRAFT_1799137 [Cryptophyta sp. CCMP2293]